MATLSGAERIRAITDEDGMFKAFDTYPWKKDKMFLVSHTLAQTEHRIPHLSLPPSAGPVFSYGES